MKLLADFSIAELKQALNGQPAYRAGQIFKWVSSGATFDEMTDLPKALRETLRTEYIDSAATIVEEHKSKDGSVKLLYRLSDGNLIEGIYMPHDYGDTLCVSTQVGCKMKCAFCASGLEGLIRNLSAGEIYSQVIAANRRFLGSSNSSRAESSRTYAEGTQFSGTNTGEIQSSGNNAEGTQFGGTNANETQSIGAKSVGAKGAASGTKRAISNIVLMGSGEPLDNYEAVTKFVRLVTESGGLNISQRSISLSTCGLPNGIKRLADDGFSVTLSISLHATTDEQRRSIMPIATRHTIAEVLDAARYYFNKSGRRVIIEYAMISNFNVTPADAARLKSLLKGMSAHLNLIPLNHIKESPLIPATKQEQSTFLRAAESQTLSTTIRRSAGTDTNAACGQLRNLYVGQKQP